MTDFKIGDTVKVVGGREEGSPPFKGEVGTVTEIDTEYTTVASRHQVWLDINGESVGYFAADLDLVESAVQDTPAEPTNVYFIVTTERGQFRSTDFDLNDSETYDAVWELIDDFDSDGGVAFVSSTDAYVMIPAGKIDSILWYNLPTE